MTKILERKNRKTGTIIALHQFTEDVLGNGIYYRWYQAECTKHGYLSDELSLRKATAIMAHPDKYCVGCIEGQKNS